jgi:hypothetical protein
MRGMIQWPNRRPPVRHWCREKCSSASDETPVAFLIIGNPLRDLFLAEYARRGQLRSCRTQARGEKQDEFLFFFGRQLVGGGLDFGERAHEPE